MNSNETHTHRDICICSDSSFSQDSSQIRHQDDLLVLEFQLMAKCPRTSESECSMNFPRECLQSKQDAATL